ncbi:MAG: twin arginine-targeting protein translocase TatB [Alphaproteobacteria bacterium RIFCSPHIGHO2_12_FULL_66_14]|jgi:sec-independent protein translocase protein TatB|nr:MAG: twin arginine-targeting protein translocase TatB [Alphaproteobacteria bacterium RIFCSPHIGHO2_12_FULL_66_14]
MFGIDSPELLVIAVVALVVIGPKELPGMLRSWGKWMSKMRGMASEFRGHVDEMVRQSDLDDVKKQLEAAPGLDLQSLDPTREIKSLIQEGVTEGEKALADAKSAVDNPLVEPESAPQTGLEAPQIAAELSPAVSDPTPVVAEAEPPAEPVASAPSEEKPAKAALAG